MTQSLRITWLCPDDKGGGVVSVAQGCVRQAALAGHDATLLLALKPTGHAVDYGSGRLASLNALSPYADIPTRLTGWLEANPQDVLVLNSCDQADIAIPYLPADLRVIYGVHDTAQRYYRNALRHEAQLDAIVAVADTVAARLRSRINDAGKLHVIYNGTVFPSSLEEERERPRRDDLLFLGGDNPVKGAHDVLALWPALVVSGFAGRLHWFGEVGENFNKLIGALPAAERITVHGRQPRQQIFKIAAQSRIVLMLSRVEPFGMATVECMGMGCLVVAWDIDTGTKEIVGAGEGLFAPLGDFTALARCVSELIAHHPAQFVASTTRIREIFSENAMWARYSLALDAILAAPPSLRPRAGQAPPQYRPPFRLYQMLPSKVRDTIRTAVGRSPRIGYALRDLRGK